MANLLYRLGLAAAKRRIATVIAWLLLFTIVGVGAATLAGKSTNDINIPGQESTTALTLMEQRFGAESNYGTATVVLEMPTGTKVSDAANVQAITTLQQKLSSLEGVASVANPLDPKAPSVSRDLAAATMKVTYNVKAVDVTAAAREALLSDVKAANVKGMTVAVTGPASEEAAGSLGGVGEIAGVVVALVVLGITYGGLVAAGLNLLTALVGVGVGALGITAMSGFITMNATTPILALMLGLAVGIDYALFMFTRFRQELSDGRNVQEAVAHATAKAGSAVVTAGLTVVIALAGLSVVGIPFLGQMGVAAAATVVVAVIVAITLVPAVLALLGNRIRPRKARKAEKQATKDVMGTVKSASKGSSKNPAKNIAKTASEASDAISSVPVPVKKSIYARWIDAILRRRWTSLAAAVIALGVIAMPLFSLHTSLVGNPTKGTTQETGQSIIAKHFGAGLNGPLLVLVDGAGATAKATEIAAKAATLPGVAVVAPAVNLPTGTTSLVTVLPTTGPTDVATVDLVHLLRDTFQTQSGAKVYVTGSTAVSVDVSESLNKALPLYLLLVVGLALVLLIMVFRSLLVPIVGVLGFLLSLGASIGATVAVFQWGWFSDVLHITTGPIMSMLPLLVIGILFGLAMDYQIFLVSRIYEAQAHGMENRSAVRSGFISAGPVVAAAALIMFSVFAGFFPEGQMVMRMISFALAVGILFDAFLVRMVIVPVLIDIFGRSAWVLPKWLKWLPHLDVEGANLKVTEARDSVSV